MIEVLSKSTKKAPNSRLLCTNKRPASSDWFSTMSIISKVKKESPKVQWANDDIILYFFKDETMICGREIIGHLNINNSHFSDHVTYIDQDAFELESISLKSEVLEASFSQIRDFANQFLTQQERKMPNGALWRLRLTSAIGEESDISYHVALEFAVND